MKVWTLIKTFICFFLIFGLFPAVSAQIGHGISSEGMDISFGSIISRDPASGSFRLSRKVSSPDIFGVVVENPMMTVHPDDDTDISVLRTGEVQVNVIYQDEPIETGDYITTSEVPGYGRLAGEEHRYVVGIALEDLSADDFEPLSDEDLEEEVMVAELLVDLQIGAREMEEEVPPSGGGDEALTPLGSQMEHYLAMIARYLAAALVAIGALYLSYRFFKANVKDGLSALGRNPLARQSIQKMMLLNMLLVVVISVGGLLLSALILLVPVFISKIM